MVYFLISVLSGIVSGLGMGGGTLLILILTAFCNVNQHTAQSMNLIFFIPTSIAAIIFHIKNKNIEKNIVWKIIITGIIGAAIGAYFSTNISANELKRFFGIFLLLVGMYELIINVKNKIKEKGEKTL